MKYVAALGAAVVLTGCAPFPHTEAPLATNFETTKQFKLQAAQHWQVIANDMADALSASLAKGSACVPSAGACPVLFVRPTSQPSAFGKAFHSLFVSRLVNKGHAVGASEGVVQISIESQAVKFSPERSQYLGAGRFTLLGLGLWGLRGLNVYSHVPSAPGVSAMGVAMATDVVQWNMSEFAKGPTPQIELVLTASAVQNGRIVARNTSVYYIADSDAVLYCWKGESCDKSPPPPAPTLRVVGDCGPATCTSTGGEAQK